VRKAGDAIRVTAQLIDAVEDRHLWSQTFDRTLTTDNIFAIQDDIANAIVEALRAPMGLEDAAPPPIARRADTQSVNAYALYLEANARFIARSQANVREAIRLFEQVTTIDPDFARGWAGLAAAASVAPSWTFTDRDYRSIAIDAAERAIALDPNLSLSYAALGEVHAYIEPKDFGQAMELFDQAIALDPQNATAHLWRGEVEWYLGYFDRSDADFAACLDLDPAYTYCLRSRAVTAALRGDVERHRQLLNATLMAGMMAIGATRPLDEPVGQDQHTVRLYELLASIDYFVGLDEFAWLAEPIYRAETDPDYDREQGFARLEARLRAQGLEPSDHPIFRNLYAYPFREYEYVEPSVFPMYWLPGLDAPENDAEQRRMIDALGLPAYWRAHGFPPQCRPVDEDDYACD
jgi:tetratricopeptide (TPR) repeat protein